ncbi:unnamed protein product [Heligmosomoides polygyrus]|uniref:Reverse transcriptase domain-containing protein n=1 Tax=Heligmosomoides polygyrus TaxID=6339 RepID=A0A3P8AFZ1_HELPZ|nr:unnamed protein product [Heligmosomoides polygyrus]
MYVEECWPVTKEVETRLSVTETKMLRWTAGVTRLDHIRNDAIRQKFGVAPIADKIREARLRWYGHVLRGREDSVRRIDLNFELKRQVTVQCDGFRNDTCSGFTAVFHDKKAIVLAFRTILYADDIALVADSREEVNEKVQLRQGVLGGR